MKDEEKTAPVGRISAEIRKSVTKFSILSVKILLCVTPGLICRAARIPLRFTERDMNEHRELEPQINNSGWETLNSKVSVK